MILKNPGFILNKINYLNTPLKAAFYVEEAGYLSKYQIDFDDNTTEIFHSQNLTYYSLADLELLQNFFRPFKLPSSRLFIKYISHTFNVPGWHTIRVLAWNSYELVYNVTFTTLILETDLCTAEASFHNENDPKSYTRSQSILLMTNVKAKCAESKFEFFWEIFK